MKVTKIAACVILLMFISGCTLYGVGFENAVMMCPVSLLLLLVLPMVAVIERTVDKGLHPEKHLAKQRERAARKAAARQDYEARMEEYARERTLKQESRRRAETIVEVKLLDGGSSKQTRYGLKGAVVGGLLFNVPGAIIGAVIPKGTKQKQRFLVKYEDGHTEIKEALPGSDECRELMRYVEW